VKYALRLAVVLSFAFGTVMPGPGPALAQTVHYVCDPCGLPCDDAVYDQPGTCPKCGMRLVDQEAAKRAKEAEARASKKVAILIFEGVEIIDYTGPWEVFGAAGFDVYTVAAAKTPITTAMGMTVVPKYTFANAPQPDILVVPGGGVAATQNDTAALKWVTDTTARTEHTMSVCNGAFILASAGLLDGLTATTTSGNIARLRADFPKTRVVDDQRYVDNGRIITTAGLSAGIDGALHVVSLILGQGNAQKVALSEEYDWHPKSQFARAALADRLIPDIDLDSIGKWTLVSTEGGRDRWVMIFRGTSDLTAAALLTRIDHDFKAAGKWTSVTAATSEASSKRTGRWTFVGNDGKPWTGTLTIETSPGEKHQYTAMLRIETARRR
jgi:putative intracellular protease/amidase/DNA-directed RNA polymerase subunit RPC12/RpoP